MVLDMTRETDVFVVLAGKPLLCCLREQAAVIAQREHRPTCRCHQMIDEVRQTQVTNSGVISMLEMNLAGKLPDSPL